VPEQAGDLFLISSDGIGSVEGRAASISRTARCGEVLTQHAGRDGRRGIDDLLAEAVDFGRGEPLPDNINLIAVSRDAMA